MSQNGRYVCGFPGRRDGYEVPAALSEADQLERFLTDFYWAGPVAALGQILLPERIRRKARTRHHPAIPEERVQTLWWSSARRGLDELRRRPAGVRYSLEGVRFAEAARDEARRRQAHLLLYPPCSHEAFTAVYPGHQPRRVLFQFHPHPDYQDSVLRPDLKVHPELIASYRDETWGDLPPALLARDRDAWGSADLILCASSFTRRTLLEAGADPARCRVVPYGVDPTAVADGVDGGVLTQPKAGFHVLFVGTGSQRKGLHHLLAAWNAADLPADSSLTIVSRQQDPGLLPALRASRRTTLLGGGISAGALGDLYRRSTLFVMPSLIEGFGAVFLEAMGHGCPVLGTVNTCLPDLGSERDGVFLTPAADPAALTERLFALAAILPDQPEVRGRAAARAAEFTWPRFRSELRRVLDDPDAWR